MKILRQATEKDFDFFYSIKAEEKNMLWTGHSTKPVRQNLYIWFKNQLDSKRRKILVYDVDERTVGYSYIILNSDNTADTAVSVMEKYEGNGFGKEIVLATKDYCFKHTSVHKILAWILENNVASKKIHLNATYKKTNVTKKILDNRIMELFVAERNE